MKEGVLLVGEPMGLFIAQEEGPLDAVSSYSVAVAGAEYNVAVGLRRLEHKVGYLTKLGRDPFGKRILAGMKENGIGTELTTFSDEKTTGFMLKSKTAHGDPEIFYFRKGSAASTLSPEDVRDLDLSGYGMLHMTGISLAISDSCRAAVLTLMKRAREEGLFLSFDPNLRPQLWSCQADMEEFINRAAGMCDLFLPGITEGRLLTGLDTPEGIASFYRKHGTKTVVIKLGSQGAYAFDGETRFLLEGFPVAHVVDTVGAGDGFAVGVLSGLLEGLPLSEAVRRGNAIGAIQVMSVGDNEGLPNRTELARFMERSGCAV